MKKVCVILGAGASKDGWNEGGPPRDPNWEPPLAAELFRFGRRPAFLGPAAPYQGVQVLASELGELGTAPLEAKLLEYAKHPHERMKRYFRQVPLYLRDLFLSVSANFTRGGASPGNLVRLFLRLLTSNHQVAFLDLNYDDYLEKALAFVDNQFAINGLLEYIEPSRAAIVGKVHGSINWGIPIAQGASSNLEALLATYTSFDPLGQHTDLIFDRSSDTTVNWRDNPTRRVLYPALTAPLAGKDHMALVCPKSHLEAFTSFLRDCEHYLVIGTSGQDADLLAFLHRSVSSVKSVYYVNFENGASPCQNNFEKACPTFANASKREGFDTGFRIYLGRQSFQDFLEA